MVIDMNDGRYNKNVFWPKELEDMVSSTLSAKRGEIVASNHVKEKMLSEYHRSRFSIKRGYNLQDIKDASLNSDLVFEVLVKAGKIEKIAFSMPYGIEKELCFVIAFRENGKQKENPVIVTAWIKRITEENTDSIISYRCPS